MKEEVVFEGRPHVGDLALALLLSLLVVTLPITIGSVMRFFWVRYRITNRRISVTGGWFGRNRSDVIYGEITKAVIVPRGWGAWGDMVLTLRDGSRLELRALPRFRELYDYIEAKLPLAARQVSGAVGSKA